MKWTRNYYVNWSEQDPLIARFFGPELTTPIELWEPARLAEYHRTMVASTIGHAAENNPFYTGKFAEAGITPGHFRDLRDLHRFPFTTKEEARHAPDTLLAVDRSRVAQVHVSTGTTGGEPIYVYSTWPDVFSRELQPEYSILAPIAEDDFVADILPYEMSSAGLSFHKVIQDGYRAAVIPIGKGGFYSIPEKGLIMMRDLKINVAITTPTYAVFLKEIADKIGLVFGRDIVIDRMWLTGEGCSPAFRERVERHWQTKAQFWYGSLECGALGIECTERDGYHLAGGHVHVEIVDPEGETVLSPGEIGELVVTTLLREGSPMIRYRTGDIGFIEELPCPCGSKLPRLRLRGRKGDQIEIAGSQYSPFYLEEHLYRMEEVGNSYRFVVLDDHLVVEVEPAEGVETSEELAQSMASRLEFATGVPNEVLFVADLPRTAGKTIRVFDRRTNK